MSKKVQVQFGAPRGTALIVFMPVPVPVPEEKQITVTIPAPSQTSAFAKPDPWPRLIGKYKNDRTWEGFDDFLKDYRRKIDQLYSESESQAE